MRALKDLLAILVSQAELSHQPGLLESRVSCFKMRLR